MILDTIAQSTRKRVDAAKEEFPYQKCRITALSKNSNTGFPFEKSLSRRGVNFICEVKKASPSKGLIAPVFPYLDIARDYEAAGAAAISVLTEPEFFKGSDKYLKEIAETVKIPVLRKDFVIDEYQIYEAKLLGASAVLLICALLDGATIEKYLGICDILGLSALVEVHDESEMKSAVSAGARVIGINNRNLHDFTVNIKNSVRLSELAPKNAILVAESGIKTAGDVASLKNCGINAVLVGETLMRAADKKKKISELAAFPQKSGKKSKVNSRSLL